MAKYKSNKMRVAGITGAIPKEHTTIYELGGKYFDREFLDTMNKTVGVENIYICNDQQYSGDLGYAAADQLIEDLGWERESIDALMFISQTQDYVIPPTSTELQHRLGLSPETFVVDMNYGCMGFVIGLMMANQFIEAGAYKRIIIINAECHRRFTADEDREGSLLIGDGASAVAVEAAEGGSDAFYMTQVDGSHTGDINLGGFKPAYNLNPYGKQYSYMNGEVVTQFMLRNLPKLVKSLFAYSETDKDDIDAFLFHQANGHMVKYTSKRMKLDMDKVFVNIANYANTSSVSIPLLICDTRKELFRGGREKVMMIGFGAGFLLSGAVMELGDLKSGKVIFV